MLQRYLRLASWWAAGLLLAGPAAAQTTQTLTPSDDAYVLTGSTVLQNTNYNNETRVAVKRTTSGTANRNGYLKFNVTPTNPSQISTAILQVWCYKISSTTPSEVTVSATGNGWTEGAITYANAPALGASQGSSAVTVGAYTSIDVTNYVRASFPAGTTTADISFGLSDVLNSGNLIEFYSKEFGSNPPQLQIVTQATPVTPPSSLTGTYYVDATGGSDANTGLSATAARQTLTQVSAQTFGPGAHILFKAGQRFSGVLFAGGSGTAAAPIVVDQYGTGARPALDGNGTSYTLRLDNQQY
ncbi:hypothetical protein A0257_10895 [Hymenobacter psoromatis]|nr:hypothetical protein A0257_10895 [Hymenobacter psoromatis]